MDRIKGLAGATKDKISQIKVTKPKLDWLKYSPIRVKLKDCTKNKGSGPSLSDKQEIAQATFDHNHLQDIFQVIWNRLDQKPKNFRSIHRTLVVLNYLLLHGSRSVSTELKFQTHHVQRLQSFYYRDEGREVGSGVRNAAKELLALLRDEDSLDSQRKKAVGGVNRYQGYSSEDARYNTRATDDYSYDSNYGYGNGNTETSYSSRSYEPQYTRPTIGGGSRNRVTTRVTKSTFDDVDVDDSDTTGGESNITFKRKKKKTPKSNVRRNPPSGNTTGSGRRGRRGHVRKPSLDEEEEVKPVVVEKKRVEKPKPKADVLGSFFKSEEPQKTKFDDGFSEDVWKQQQKPARKPVEKKSVTANDFFNEPIIPVKVANPSSPVSSPSMDLMKETSHGLEDAFDDGFEDGFSTPGPSQNQGGQGGGVGKDKDELLNFFENTDLFPGGSGVKPGEGAATGKAGSGGSGGKMTIREMRQGSGRKVARSTVTTTTVPPQNIPYYPPPAHTQYNTPPQQYPHVQYNTPPQQYQQNPYVGYPPQNPPVQYTTNPQNPFY